MSHPLVDVFKADLRGMLLSMGQVVTFAAGTSEGVEIRAVVEEGPGLAASVPPGLSEEYRYRQARWMTAVVHADDLSAAPAPSGDVLTMDGADWTVRQWEPILQGAGYRLWCSTDERGRA